MIIRHSSDVKAAYAAIACSGGLPGADMVSGWDDRRAIFNPYDKAHPNQPPRTFWSNWDKPGEQAHWCRGGTTYPIHYCKSFVKYKGQQVKTCLKANVSIFQDGYIDCSIIDSVGCERCYEEFERRQKWEKT